MPASLEYPPDKRISEDINGEESLVSGRLNAEEQHRHSLVGEKDMVSPMTTSNTVCDGSFKTLSLTPCDIDCGCSPQQIMGAKSNSLSSKGRCSLKEVIDKKKCSLQSSSEIISAALQLKDLGKGSPLKFLGLKEDNCLDPRLNIPLFFPVSQ